MTAIWKFLIYGILSTSTIRSIQSHQNTINCTDLLNSNVDEKKLQYAKTWKPLENEILTDSQIYQKIQQNCSKFLENQKYFLRFSNSTDEENFRIAFTIVTFQSASQVERLLRTIYRPWNYYCIHIDKKSDKKFTEALEELVKCLNSKYKNVVNTENRVDVQWGKMSVLTADLNCMKELYERYKDWKYLINLTGQEFPLKTNRELVTILKAYKGANNLEGTYKRRNEYRVPVVKMPFPLIWFKGSVHITVNRDFIKFVFESPKSQVLLEALKGRHVPDEQFFSTLNHNSLFRIPGSFLGDPDDLELESQPLINFLTRYKNWGEYSCESQLRVRGICIWGVGDLPKLVNVPHLFTNKFYENFQPATLRCMEEWYYDKINNEIQTDSVAINETFYSKLPFVVHRFIPPTI